MKRKLRKRCLQELQRTFGLTEFRPGQEAAISALLAGRDLLCILPTGAGKSLCWQLPAIMQTGLTIVVSPLIALMRDQVQQLLSKGVPACTLDSLMSPEERNTAMREIANGRIRIVFVSPERLESYAFRQLCRNHAPSMLVIDEAHCVIRWGEEFRPAYQKIREFAGMLQARPVVCAMTATADPVMQKEIAEALGMKRYKRVRLPVIRDNIHYHVTTALHKTPEILRILSMQQGKTVIFCRSRSRTESLAAQLTRNGYSAAFYHAGMDRDERLAVQNRFSEGGIDVLAATTAFGMGVDIPDIRCVIHDYLPDNVTDFVQQSGRAGRDRMDANSFLILTPYDFQLVNRPFDTGNRRMRSIGKLAETYSRWKPVKQMLSVCLTKPCIPAALSKCFSHRKKPCGHCSACIAGPLRRRIPPLYRMRSWQVRAWLLDWQREQMAARENCPPWKILSGRELNRCARLLEYPRNEHHDGIIRLIHCLRQNYHVGE